MSLRLISYIAATGKCIDRMQWYTVIAVCQPDAGGECVCGASISKVSGQEQCILQIYSYSIAAIAGVWRQGDDKRPDCGVIML